MSWYALIPTKLVGICAFARLIPTELVCFNSYQLGTLLIPTSLVVFNSYQFGCKTCYLYIGQALPFGASKLAGFWALLLLFAVVWLLLVLAKPYNCPVIRQCSLPQITLQTQANCNKVSGCFWCLKLHPKTYAYSVGLSHTCHTVSPCFYWMQNFLHLVRKKFGLCLVFYFLNNSGQLGKGCFAKLPE